MGQKGQINQPRGSVGAPGAPGSAGIMPVKERFDIVNEYAWTTVAKNSQLRAEAPNVYVTGYELEKSQFQQFIEGYLNLTKKITTGSKSLDPGVEFYKSLYAGSSKSKASFNFPYFDNNVRSFSNNFDDTFSKVSSRGAQFGGSVGSTFQDAEREIVGVAGAAGQATGAFRSAAAALGPSNAQNLLNSVGDFTSAVTGGSQSGATGTYIETPKFYQYENTDAPLTVRFILANTIDEEDAGNNLEFIHEFTRINRPKRLGPIEMTFPYIYHIEVPCQRYIEWAFLQDLQIELLGTKRKIQNRSGGCTIVPEAYGCTFQFKSLTVEAANFMNPDLLCSDNCAFDDYVGKQRDADIASLEQQKTEHKEIAKVEEAKIDFVGKSRKGSSEENYWQDRSNNGRPSNRKEPGGHQSHKGQGFEGETNLDTDNNPRVNPKDNFPYPNEYKPPNTQKDRTPSILESDDEKKEKPPVMYNEAKGPKGRDPLLDKTDIHGSHKGSEHQRQKERESPDYWQKKAEGVEPEDVPWLQELLEKNKQNKKKTDKPKDKKTNLDPGGYQSFRGKDDEGDATLPKDHRKNLGPMDDFHQIQPKDKTPDPPVEEFREDWWKNDNPNNIT